MTNNALIQSKLPQDIQAEAAKYQIADKFIQEIPDLIELLLRSKTIEKFEEKQNWFNLMPLMNTEQIGKLRDILVKEKTKLKEIEEKYEQKKTDIKEKYLSKWQTEGYIQKVVTIKKEESQHQKLEEQEAEALLAGI